MKLTKDEKELDKLSLKNFGLSEEEIEGYFEYVEGPKKKIIIINSRRKT